MKLCVHADYVSEAEGALLKLQQCEAGSKRQAYTLDAATSTVHLRNAPEFCLHSVDTSLHSGQPVLVLRCPQQMTKSAADNDSEFVGHPLTSSDKDFESGIIKEVMAEANKSQGDGAAPEPSEKTLHADELELFANEEEALNHQIHSIMNKRKSRDEQIKAMLLQADTTAAKAKTSASTLHQGSPTDVLKKVQAAHQSGEQQLMQSAEEERKHLRGVISAVEGKYHSVADKALEQQKRVKSAAHDHSIELTHQAKLKTKAVIAKAREELKKKLEMLSSTLTDSTDSRQRARAHLVELRSQHADEVQLAQAALDLAKVNKATHQANANARAEAKLAHDNAARTISFAKTIMASRLKAIHTTAQLTVDKMELHAHAAMTEAKEALSRTTQSVLMALNEADASTELEGIVGQDAIATVDLPAELKGSTSAGTGENAEFDMDLDTSIVEDPNNLDDDELLERQAAVLSNKPADTIYTSQMHKCKFPFAFNGQQYYHCEKSAHGDWCATQVHSDGAVREWDYCVLNQHAVALAKQAAMEAAKMEIKRVLEATGAHLSTDALRESLKAAAAAQATTAEAAVTSAKPEDEDLTSRKPVIGDVQAESQVDKMINEASH